MSCQNLLVQNLLVSYIPPWAVVVLHSDTSVQEPHPREGYNYYITCYLGNITVEERCGQHS